jgi:hypothetical protein
MMMSLSSILSEVEAQPRSPHAEQLAALQRNDVLYNLIFTGHFDIRAVGAVTVFQPPTCVFPVDFCVVARHKGVVVQADVVAVVSSNRHYPTAVDSVAVAFGLTAPQQRAIIDSAHNRDVQCIAQTPASLIPIPFPVYLYLRNAT